MLLNSSRTELSNEDLNRRWLAPKYVEQLRNFVK